MHSPAPFFVRIMIVAAVAAAAALAPRWAERWLPAAPSRAAGAPPNLNASSPNTSGLDLSGLNVSGPGVEGRGRLLDGDSPALSGGEIRLIDSDAPERRQAFHD